MHALGKCNEICGGLLQRGTLNDSLCPSSSSAFRKRNQRASLARALGAKGKLITSVQAPESMEVLEGTERHKLCSGAGSSDGASKKDAT